jgi:carbonic anhydrase
MENFRDPNFELVADILFWFAQRYDPKMDISDDIEDEKDRFNRFVELNVVEQVLDLGKTSIVQTAWESGQAVHVHGWVYDIHDGLIKDLDITLRDNKSLSDVYQLDI